MLFHVLTAGALVVTCFAAASPQRGAATRPPTQPATPSNLPAQSPLVNPEVTLGTQTKDPYAQLFPARPELAAAFESLQRSLREHRSTQGPASRKTVCGMTVWTVDASQDRRSVVGPTTPGVDHKITKIPPGQCAE